MSSEESFCYGVVQPGDDDPDGPRLIRVCDLEDGRVNERALRGISPETHAQYRRSILRGGEILVSIVGTIGRLALASRSLAGTNIARAVAKIPVREFDASYVYTWLSSSIAAFWMVGNAREVARKTLNLQQLRTLPVPLPPIAEQREIVSQVEAAFGVIERLEAQHSKASALLDRLDQATLARAFRGTLILDDK